MNIQIISGTVQITDMSGFLPQLADLSQRFNITIQALNADMVAGTRHVQFAVEKAIRSFESGRNTANNLGMEIMLYASGHRQIEKALHLGARSGENRVTIILVGENGTDAAAGEIKAILDTEDASVVDYAEDKKNILLETFEITRAELDAVGEDKIPELVLERVALVDVLK